LSVCLNALRLGIAPIYHGAVFLYRVGWKYQLYCSQIHDCLVLLGSRISSSVFESPLSHLIEYISAAQMAVPGLHQAPTTTVCGPRTSYQCTLCMRNNQRLASCLSITFPMIFFLPCLYTRYSLYGVVEFAPRLTGRLCRSTGANYGQMPFLPPPLTFLGFEPTTHCVQIMHSNH